MSARCFQTMVPMRDGIRLNTFVFLPAAGGPRFPVILHRTPYGITGAGARDKFDVSHAHLPPAAEPMRGSILRGWQKIVAHGYAAVYQDCRGRNGSEGEDRVYADDAADGYDTLEWVAAQDWTNGRVGMSGSSAGATTTFAAASTRHPSLRAFFAQAGGSSIYDDVVYEGNAIEMERLWLWVAKNIPGLSKSHREAVLERFGIGNAELDAAAERATARYNRLDAARSAALPFVGDPDWLRLPLLHYPDFAIWQPFLDEIVSHPAPDAFRAAHNFRRTIDIPGFHVTSWFDIFQTSVIAAFQEIQARTGTQKLWVGPNEHYFVYADNFWPKDPYFDWFGHWLKDEKSGLVDEPAVYYSPRAWVDEADRAAYRPNDWRQAERWPPPRVAPLRLYLRGDGSLDKAEPGGPSRTYTYDPRRPVPTLGGRNMLIDAGPRDQRPAQGLPDYGPVYRGEPLTGDLTVAGNVRVTLHVSSDRPDTDFVAKLLEIWPDGRAMLLMDGVVRAMYRDGTEQPLVPGETRPVTIGLGDIHHTFRAGSRIGIDITSSNFPRRARNTNSGHRLMAADGDSDIRVATNTVHHGPATPSYVELPVLATP